MGKSWHLKCFWTFVMLTLWFLFGDKLAARSLSPFLDLQNGQDGCSNEKIRRLAVSPNGRYLAASLGYEAGRLWDTDTGNFLFTFSDDIVSMAFSLDNKYLLVDNKTGVSTLRDVHTGTVVRHFTHKESEPRQAQTVYFSPDMTQILTIGYDSAQLWDLSTGRQVYAFPLRDISPYPAQFSPDGKYILIADESVTLWDAKTNKEIHTFDMQGGSPEAVISSNGRHLLLYVSEQEVVLWNTKTFEKLFSLSEAFGGLSPDSNYVWTANLDDELSLWDIATGTKLYTVAFNTPGFNLTFSSDNRYLIGFNSVIDGAVDYIVFDVRAGKVKHLSLGNSPSAPLLALPNSQNIIVGAEDGYVYLYDIHDGKEIRKFC
jgi:WD40 repeat protein